MKPSVQLVLVVITLAAVCLLLSYAGIFQYIAMPTSIQLLLQVLAIAIIVLSIATCAMYYLNKGIDQSDQA
jgi:hypothetical protein